MTFNMQKQNFKESGKRRGTFKKRHLSTRKTATPVLKEKLSPLRKSKRMTHKNVKIELEDTSISDTSTKPIYEQACSRCKILEDEVERLQNELNKLKDKKNSGTPKISALCALEIANKQANNEIQVEIKDDKINLGQNFFCSLASWQVMKRTDRMTEWYNALLRGTFGEDAKNYRVKPRVKDNKPFDSDFLNVAEGHFCSFLDRRVFELKGKKDVFSMHLLDFFESNRDTLIKQLPANLSDRAYAMYRKSTRKYKAPRKVTQSRQKSLNSQGILHWKMLTQPQPKRELQLLYQTSSSSEESGEDELEQ